MRSPIFSLFSGERFEDWLEAFSTISTITFARIANVLERRVCGRKGEGKALDQGGCYLRSRFASYAGEKRRSIAGQLTNETGDLSRLLSFISLTRCRILVTLSSPSRKIRF